MKPLFLFSLLAGIALISAHAGIIEFDDGDIEIKTRDAAFTEETVDGVNEIRATFEIGEKWSFLRIIPAAGSWDLTKFSGIEVEITNAGDTEIRPGVRVDEAGGDSGAKQAWNSAQIQTLAPEETKLFTVQFGKDYNKPKDIDQSRIGAIQIFLGSDRTESSSMIVRSIKGLE